MNEVDNSQTEVETAPVEQQPAEQPQEASIESPPASELPQQKGLESADVSRLQEFSEQNPRLNPSEAALNEDNRPSAEAQSPPDTAEATKSSEDETAPEAQSAPDTTEAAKSSEGETAPEAQSAPDTAEATKSSDGESAPEAQTSTEAEDAAKSSEDETTPEAQSAPDTAEATKSSEDETAPEAQSAPDTAEATKSSEDETAPEAQSAPDTTEAAKSSKSEGTPDPDSPTSKEWSMAELTGLQPHRDPSTLQEGFASPHASHEFASEIASGGSIHEALTDASTADGPIDGVAAVLKADAAASDLSHPLGDQYHQWFTEEYGRAPYTEAREGSENEAITNGNPRDLTSESVSVKTESADERKSSESRSESVAERNSVTDSSDPGGGDYGAILGEMKNHDWNAEILGRVPMFYQGEYGMKQADPDFTTKIGEPAEYASQRVERHVDDHPLLIRIEDTVIGQQITKALEGGTIDKAQAKELFTEASKPYAEAARHNTLATGNPAIGYVARANDTEKAFVKIEHPEITKSSHGDIENSKGVIITDEPLGASKFEDTDGLRYLPRDEDGNPLLH